MKRIPAPKSTNLLPNLPLIGAGWGGGPFEHYLLPFLTLWRERKEVIFSTDEVTGNVGSYEL